MKTPLEKKSTTRQIRARFDTDVERFSSLETGQQAIVDAPLMLGLIAELAERLYPGARTLLDIGCGAGNLALKIVGQLPGVDCDLVDLSPNMLARAKARLNGKAATVRAFCGDFREVPLPEGHYDIVAAAAVLHHLRDEADWLRAFQKIHALLVPGGGLFVSDMFFHAHPGVQHVLWERYGRYLERLGGADYRQKVLDYIDLEDSPRDFCFQADLLRKVGFSRVDMLHKNGCFGAYLAVK